MRDDGIKRAGISRWRYRELKAFCMQYEEKRYQAAALLSLCARRIDGMPRAQGTSDPTAAAAARRAHLLEDCRLIERTAADADPAGSRAIILNAAQGVRYEETGYYGDRSSFFRARERFFVALDRRLREREEAAG